MIATPSYRHCTRVAMSCLRVQETALDTQGVEPHDDSGDGQPHTEYDQIPWDKHSRHRPSNFCALVIHFLSATFSIMPPHFSGEGEMGPEDIAAILKYQHETAKSSRARKGQKATNKPNRMRLLLEFVCYTLWCNADMTFKLTRGSRQLCHAWKVKALYGLALSTPPILPRELHCLT
nr:hypothetical protein CFP56_54942 [Quercus suber]